MCFGNPQAGVLLGAMVCLTMSGLEPNSAWPGAENQLEAAFRQGTERKGSLAKTTTL